MKKLFPIILLGLSLAACNDDNSSSGPTIYRKWYYKDTTSGTITIPYPDHEPCGKDYVEFYDVNRVRGVDIDDCVADIDWERTFTFENNVLTIFEGPFGLSATVTTLDKDNLVYEYDDDMDGDGVNEHHIVRLTSR